MQITEDNNLNTLSIIFKIPPEPYRRNVVDERVNSLSWSSTDKPTLHIDTFGEQ